MIRKDYLKKILVGWNDVLFSSFIIFVCLALSYYFPIDGNFQSFSRGIFFFLIIPGLYIKIILKKELKDFGLNLSDWRSGLFWMATALAAALLVSYGIIRFTNFESSYISVIPIYAIGSFHWFLLYEFVFANFLLVLQEAFFNGFVLFSFKERLGYWAILIVTLIFLGFLALTNNLDWRMMPAIILIPFGSWTAFKTNSLVYAYLMGLLFIIILDAYVIYIFK